MDRNNHPFVPRLRACLFRGAFRGKFRAVPRLFRAPTARGIPCAVQHRAQPVSCAARSATARISSVRVCAVWLFNNVVLGSLGAPNLARMFLYVGAETSPDRMPTARSAVGAFVAAILVEDVLFTFGHMLLHTPRLYKAIHKLHHEYKVFTFGCWVVLSVVGYMSGI